MATALAKVRAKKSTNDRFTKWLAALPPEIAVLWAQRLFTTPTRFEAPAVERAALAAGRPFTVKHTDARGRRQRLATWTFGDGPSVLLVHGWAGRGGQLHALIAPLVAAGHRVIVFDAPGHGESTGKDSSLVDFVGAIEAVDRQIGPVRAIVGHSMGGAAAALAALRAPLSGLRIERVVTIGAPVAAQDALDRFAHALSLPDATKAELKARMERTYGTTFDALDVRTVGPRRPALLAIHDRSDKDVPFADAVALAAAWNAPLVATDGLGHRRLLRDASVVAEAVRFVAEGLRGKERLDEPFPRYDLISGRRAAQ